MIKTRINNLIINNALNSKIGFEILKSNFQNSILTYHGVSDDVCIYNSRHITTKNFIKQLKFLKSYCNVISLNDYIHQKFNAKKINIAITFDDGYKNNFDNALPLLEQFNMPATFFITGINTIKQDFLWADFVEILAKKNRANFNLDEYEFRFMHDTFYDQKSNKSIHEIIKFINPEFEFKQKLYDSIHPKIKENIFKTEETFWKVMTDQEIFKASQSKLISIQSHGMLHNNLGSISFNNATKEIYDSKNYLENLTQKEVNAIGYPDGSYTKELVDFCEKNKIAQQFATDYFLNKEDIIDVRIHNRKGIFEIGTYKNQLYNTLKPKTVFLNKVKKIIHIIPCLAGGGAEILVGQIAIEQVNQGFEVHIILLENEHHTYQNYPLRNELEKKVEIHTVICNSNLSLIKKGIKVNNDNLLKLLECLNPDVIHSHLYKSEILARTYASKKCIFISHLHDNMWQFNPKSTNNIKNNLILKIERKWLFDKYKKNNNKFISISSDTTNYFNKLLPLKIRSNIYELNNAINIEQFCLKERTTIGKKIKFINVGNLVTKKGHELLIDIFTLLKQKHNLDFQLDILGFGVLFDQLNTKIRKNGMENYIYLRGNVKNVNEYMENSDIYIHTASYEPFGMVFLEAMASGLPIISSNGKGNKSLVKTDFNGFFIDSREPEAYVNKILEITGDEAKYNRFSRNSIAFIKRFDIKEYVKKLSEIYFNKQ